MRARSEHHMSLPDAIAANVNDGDTIALEGFTHLIPFAAGHEIIRQGRKDLTLVRMTPDLIYDQLIGMGCATQARLLLRRQPRRRLPAPVPRRRRARLAGARWRSSSTRMPGSPTRTSRARRGLPFAVLRGYSAPTSRSTTPRSPGRLPVHRRAALRRAGARPRRRRHPRAAGRPRRATSCSGACRACRRRRCSRPTRAIVTVEEVVDELEPRPHATCCRTGS